MNHVVHVYTCVHMCMCMGAWHIGLLYVNVWVYCWALVSNMIFTHIIMWSVLTAIFCSRYHVQTRMEVHHMIYQQRSMCPTLHSPQLPHKKLLLCRVALRTFSHYGARVKLTEQIVNRFKVKLWRMGKLLDKHKGGNQRAAILKRWESEQWELLLDRQDLEEETIQGMIKRKDD